MEAISFASAYGVFALAMLSPGPDFAVTVRNSIARGRMAGMWCACGIACGNAVHMTLMGFGLGSLVKQSPVVFSVMQFFAAGYLIYLGGRCLTSVLVVPQDGDISVQKNLQSASPWRDGFFISLVNSKAIVFWLSFFTLVVGPTVSPAATVAFLVLLAFSLFIWFATVAYFLSTPKIRAAFLRRQRFFNLLVGLVLICLGASVLMSRV